MQYVEARKIRERVRRELERSRRLRAEFRAVLAESMVLVMQSRAKRERHAPTDEAVQLAEQAKQNRGRRVRNDPLPPGRRAAQC